MPTPNLLNKTWQKLVAIVGAVMMLGGFIGGWIWIDARYAKADEPKKNQVMIQKHITKDDIRWYQDQQAYLRSKYGVTEPSKLPTHAFEQYRYYEEQKTVLEEELKNLMRKQ